MDVMNNLKAKLRSYEFLKKILDIFLFCYSLQWAIPKFIHGILSTSMFHNTRRNIEIEADENLEQKFNNFQPKQQ